MLKTEVVTGQKNLPTMMKAVVTKAQGGFEQLVYQDVPVPKIMPGQVLVRVLAAGVNNTEINTRMGWYSSSVVQATNQMADNCAPQVSLTDGGWGAPTPFPLIQGTDCCGEVVAVAEQANESLLGERVLVRPCTRVNGFDDLEAVWMASDFDGAFAEFVVVNATEVLPVDSHWSDAELASIPCAYGTAENMLQRAQVKASDVVLVTGASGGVGSATVQLAKRRGAFVIAVSSVSKHELLLSLGVDKVLAREDDLLAALGENSVDVVVDNVAGASFGKAFALLKRGGRLVTSGAIAGPIVELDLRQLYLKDVTLIGTTTWDESVFPNLMGYIERDEIKPLVAQCFSLADIVQAQKVFLKKQHVGKIVLIPEGRA
ncbi:zinc-binding dehydrogenase [Marinomonas pollencensis]|uniref:zinc-binding dehydrogenase n=1 Tax=Marinomonas pollencensis TaxID=491954 RepID=UPI001FE7BD9A|nr:zinc-binding dehydrogenase [Marinomonas pollencensis]